MGDGHKSFIKCFTHPAITFSIHSTYFKMNYSLVPPIIGGTSHLFFVDELYKIVKNYASLDKIQIHTFFIIKNRARVAARKYFFLFC